MKDDDLVEVLEHYGMSVTYEFGKLVMITLSLKK
jgi:hypothetical protein